MQAAAWPVVYQASSALEAALSASRLESQQEREAGLAPAQHQALPVAVALPVPVAASRIAATAERALLAGRTLAQGAVQVAQAVCVWEAVPLTAV